MDYATLRTEILSGPHAVACAPHVVNYDAPKTPGAGRKDQAIADVLNAASGGDTYVERFVTARAMLAELDPSVAATILDKLEAAGAAIPAVKWAMKYVTSDGIDVGHASTRAMFNSLVTAGVLTQAEADAVIGMSTKAVNYAESVFGRSVTSGDVSIALRGGAAFDPRA